MSTHKKLPYGAFCICYMCWKHIEREENEITRHLRDEHGAATKQGHNHYSQCRLIPKQVAVELLGDEERVDYLNDLHIPGLNDAPKTPWATIPDIRGMFNSRQIQQPAWLGNLVLPPTGNPNTTYTIQIAQGGPAQPAVAQPGQAPLVGAQVAQVVQPAAPAPPGQPAQPPIAQGQADALASAYPPPAPAPPAENLELPLVTPGPDKYEFYKKSGPTAGRVIKGQEVFHCRQCGPAQQGDVVSMFNHHNYFHCKDLQAVLSEKYNDKYFAGQQQAGVVGQALDDLRRALIITPNLPYVMGKSEDYHRDVAYQYRCYLCDHDAGTDFWDLDLDLHFMRDHKQVREGLAREVLRML